MRGRIYALCHPIIMWQARRIQREYGVEDVTVIVDDDGSKRWFIRRGAA